jgi:hypothetical protein
MSDHEHGTYVRKVREDQRRYVQELLEDNRKLHALVAAYKTEEQRWREEVATARAASDKVQLLEARLRAAEEEGRRLQDQAHAARRALEQHEREQGQLQRQLEQVDEDNRRYSDQFATLEQQNNNLANLYVASYRLHGTLDREEVVDALKEIIANLVGSEEMALFEIDSTRGRLRLVASNGIQPEPYQTLSMGQGAIGRALQSGETLILGEGDLRSAGEETLTAVIPLKLGERVSGLIAIFRLLPQKAAFEDVDRELFDLLASHAAMALHCTALHALHARLSGASAAGN